MRNILIAIVVERGKNFLSLSDASSVWDDSGQRTETGRNTWSENVCYVMVTYCIIISLWKKHQDKKKKMKKKKGEKY